MQLEEALQILKENDLMVEDTDVLSHYESKFTVGTGFASDKVIQWSRARSGALEGGEKFYPKDVVLKLIKEYEAEIKRLEDELYEAQSEAESLKG